MVFAEFGTQQRQVFPRLPDGFVHSGKHQYHSAYLLLFVFEASAHIMSSKCSLNARWDPLPVSLQTHLVSQSAPLAALQLEATKCSSLSPGHLRENCRPFVSIQNGVPATHNPTFLHLALANWNDVAAPWTGQRPGSQHVARITRRGRWNWHCVVLPKL